MKPIEAGCLAVITRGLYSGSEVTVLKYIGRLDYYLHHNRWEVNKVLTDTIGRQINHIPEDWLLRVDGYEELETEKKEITA